MNVQILSSYMNTSHLKLNPNIESSQCALLDDVLYHFYQPMVKGFPAAQRLIWQLELPSPYRQGELRSFHNSHATKLVGPCKLLKMHTCI